MSSRLDDVSLIWIKELRSIEELPVCVVPVVIVCLG